MLNQYLWQQLFLRDIKNSEQLPASMTWKEFYRFNCKPIFFNRLILIDAADEWRWSTEDNGRADVLQVSSDGKVCWRPSYSGINPCIRTSKPFTKHRNYIEIKLEVVGDWFRFGVADQKIVLSNAPLLGLQHNSLNVALCRNGINCSVGLDLIRSENWRTEIGQGSVMGIKYDAFEHKFFFLVDGFLYGTVAVPETVPIEMLYPTLQISYSTRVKIMKGIAPLVSESMSLAKSC